MTMSEAVLFICASLLGIFAIVRIVIACITKPLSEEEKLVRNTKLKELSEKYVPIIKKTIEDDKILSHGSDLLYTNRSCFVRIAKKDLSWISGSELLHYIFTNAEFGLNQCSLGKYTDPFGDEYIGHEVNY